MTIEEIDNLLYELHLEKESLEVKRRHIRIDELTALMGDHIIHIGDEVLITDDCWDYLNHHEFVSIDKWVLWGWHRGGEGYVETLCIDASLPMAAVAPINKRTANTCLPLSLVWDMRQAYLERHPE